MWKETGDGVVRFCFMQVGSKCVKGLGTCSINDDVEEYDRPRLTIELCLLLDLHKK
jgi:hypothetical protein